MLGNTLAVYNGREHVAILISEQMIGHLSYNKLNFYFIRYDFLKFILFIVLIHWKLFYLFKLGEFVQTRNYRGHTKTDKKAKK